MAEVEWLQGADSRLLLDNVRGRPSQRRLRLYAISCCRRFWNAMTHSTQQAVLIAEQWVDGKTDVEELRRILWPLLDDYSISHVARTPLLLDHPDAHVAADATALECVKAAGHLGRHPLIPHGATMIEEHRFQALLLRDIIGNPFRPTPTIDPAWRRWHDGTIAKLAQQMYDSRDFASMPILADALEEAGCTSGDILEHCRGPGPHVLDCWVVDLVLGQG